MFLKNILPHLLDSVMIIKLKCVFLIFVTMDKYNRLKIVCMFDLPTETNDDKREYRIFRKSLLENGFVMIQYSVYVRTCPNREFAKKFLPKLKKIVPSNGNVRLVTITEKQYNDMEFIVGKRNLLEDEIGEKRIVVI